MIIRKIENNYIIKVINHSLNKEKYFDIEEIKKLFQIILEKLKKKYSINGLLDIDVYANENYGMIIEIEPLKSYYDEIDLKIHFHLDSIFLTEIDSNEINKEKEVYYYKGKYYSPYNKLKDSDVLYKVEDFWKLCIKIV